MHDDPLRVTDDDRRALLAGVRLFDAGQFFEAHELWEPHWRNARGARRSLLQGLILAAAALVQRERGIPGGAGRLWLRAADRLGAALAQPACPLDVTAFGAFSRSMAAAIASGAPPPRLAPLLRGDA